MEMNIAPLDGCAGGGTVRGVKQFNELPLLLRMGAVTQLLGLGKKSVVRLLEEGVLEGVAVPGAVQRKVTRESVRRYLKLPMDGVRVGVQ